MLVLYTLNHPHALNYMITDLLDVKRQWDGHQVMLVCMRGQLDFLAKHRLTT